MSFGGVFYDFLDGPWEQARGYLKEHLEQLFSTTTAQWSNTFNEEGELNPDIIPSATKVPTFYISNEGPKGALKWARVNLINGVKNRLALGNFALATANTVLGRGAGSGNYTPLTVGEGLEIDGTELKATGEGGYQRSFLLMGG